MQQWASIASNAFDSAFQDINKDIIEGGSVMKDLVNVAQQVVEAILLEFEKLAIINPILNSIFGVSAGGGSLLPTLGNSALGSLFNGSSGGIMRRRCSAAAALSRTSSEARQVPAQESWERCSVAPAASTAWLLVIAA